MIRYIKNTKEIDPVLMGMNIRIRREDLGIKRKEMAESVGISTGHYVQIECGNRGVSLKTLYKISQILGVSMDLLANESQKYRDDRAHLIATENIVALLSFFNPEMLIYAERIMRAFTDSHVNRKK